jgi:lysophospholipase L1-like esterase
VNVCARSCQRGIRNSSRAASRASFMFAKVDRSSPAPSPITIAGIPRTAVILSSGRRLSWAIARSSGLKPMGVISLRRPLKIAGLGDSIMAGDGQPVGQTRVGSWLAKSGIYADGRLVPLVYGYGGLTAIGHRSQSYKNDYLEANPDLVVYHLGHNDLPGTGGSFTLTQRNNLRAAITATIEEAVASGARVLVPELIPLAGVSETEYALHNEWLASLPGLVPGVIFMPGYEGLYDPTLTANTPDGTHPNQVGSGLLARKFADWISPLISGVRPFRELVVEAGVSGVTLQRDPITLPFQTGVGGGYPSTSSETLSGSGVIIDVSGDGNHIVSWVGGSTGSFADDWFFVSFRVKADLITPASKRALIVDAASDGQSFRSYFEGQIDTQDEWGHVICLRKASATATQHVVRVILAELIAADSTSVGQVEIAEFYIHDLATSQASNPGVDWHMP